MEQMTSGICEWEKERAENSARITDSEEKNLLILQQEITIGERSIIGDIEDDDDVS